MKTHIKIAFAALAMTAVLAGCATSQPYYGQPYPQNPPPQQGQPPAQQQGMSKTGKGALIGALAGVAAGLLSGDDATERRQRALVGAGVGGLAGAAIGNYQDRQERALREQMAGTGVDVVRDGNNITLNMPSGITFDFDKSNLKPEFYPVLDNVAQDAAGVQPDHRRGGRSYRQRRQRRLQPEAVRTACQRGVELPDRSWPQPRSFHRGRRRREPPGGEQRLRIRSRAEPSCRDHAGADRVLIRSLVFDLERAAFGRLFFICRSFRLRFALTPTPLPQAGEGLTVASGRGLHRRPGESPGPRPSTCPPITVIPAKAGIHGRCFAFASTSKIFCKTLNLISSSCANQRLALADTTSGPVQP